MVEPYGILDDFEVGIGGACTILVVSWAEYWQIESQLVSTL